MTRALGTSGSGIALAFLLAPLLAGCLTQSGPQPDPLKLVALPEVPGLPIVQDHDHSDPLLHTGSFGVAQIATASGYDDKVPAGVGYTELDVKNGWAYLCRAGGVPGIGPYAATGGGFEVFNVSAPRAPAHVGAFDGPGCADIKVNDANDLVIFGTQRNPLLEPVTAQAQDPEARLPRGVYLVGVQDKATPALERFVPIPLNGVHTLHYAHVANRELVFVQTYDWLPDSGFGLPVPSTGYNNPATQRVNIFEIVRGADGKRDLQLLTAFLLPDVAPPGVNYFPHDVTVQKHPLTGHWLAYVAYWDQGLVILDIDDPAQPQVVSQFRDTSPSKIVHLHQARPFPALIAGRHVTVLEPELQSADETGQFTLVDTTDPAKPVRLGFWTLPGRLVIPGEFLFSPHNFNLANGRIYLAHNHAGVWVVDASTEERLHQPVAVGFWQPHDSQREDACHTQRVWSAFYVDGYVYASDSCAGLRVLQFGADEGLVGKGPWQVMPPQ